MYFCSTYVCTIKYFHVYIATMISVQKWPFCDSALWYLQLDSLETNFCCSATTASQFLSCNREISCYSATLLPQWQNVSHLRNILLLCYSAVVQWMDVIRGTEIYAVKLGDKRVKLKKEQLTTNVLAKIFDVFPDTIILSSDDGYVATPNAKGIFEDLDDVPIWSCQGTSCNPPVEATSSSSSYPYQAPSKKGGKGKGKGRVQWVPQHTTSYLPSLRGGSNRPPGVVAQETRLRSNVTEPPTTADWEFPQKIDFRRWSRNGWDKASNLPLMLTEATATVLNVSSCVSEEAFEGNSVVLLDADYLKVLDTPST